jgi:hypothetical protein
MIIQKSTPPSFSVREDDIQKYQSLIGAMQWAISIGHFDIAVHVMTMSSFRASPCHGHLE